jgi:hypothetical protein
MMRTYDTSLPERWSDARQQHNRYVVSGGEVFLPLTELKNLTFD